MTCVIRVCRLSQHRLCTDFQYFSVQIADQYAFIPREAVSRFLLYCSECQRKPPPEVFFSNKPMQEMIKKDIKYGSNISKRPQHLGKSDEIYYFQCNAASYFFLNRTRKKRLQRSLSTPLWASTSTQVLRLLRKLFEF